MQVEKWLDSKIKRSIDFFFNDTATTEIYTLSLHDALPIWADEDVDMGHGLGAPFPHGHAEGDSAEHLREAVS